MHHYWTNLHINVNSHVHEQRFSGNYHSLRRSIRLFAVAFQLLNQLPNLAKWYKVIKPLNSSVVDCSIYTRQNSETELTKSTKSLVPFGYAYITRHRISGCTILYLQCLDHQTQIFGFYNSISSMPISADTEFLVVLNYYWLHHQTQSP